jgi:hypothetical protein
MRGQNSVVCPGVRAGLGQLDPRHAGLGRVSADRGAAWPAPPAGPGISGGFARTQMGAREGLGAGPGGGGTRPASSVAGPPRHLAAGGCDIQPRQPLHSYWPRPHGSRPRAFMPAQGGGSGRSDRGEQPAIGPCWSRPSRSPRAAAVCDPSGTSRQQHQQTGTDAGHSSSRITYLVHAYGEFCPFRLHQIRDTWPTQGRVTKAGAVRSDLRAAYRPRVARTGHPGWGWRLGRRLATGDWGGRRAAGSHGLPLRHVPVTVEQGG